MTDETKPQSPANPAPEPDPTVDVPPGSISPLAKGAASGHAAYDVTLGRYVGGVHRGNGSKAAAESSDQAKAATEAGHDVEVREV